MSETRLRAWEIPDDTEMFVEWVNHDPSILEGLRMDREVWDDFALRTGMLKAYHDPRQEWFVVERDGEPIGIAAATHMAEVEGRKQAEVHQVVSPYHRGGKTAYRLIQASIEHAFNGMGIDRLIGLVPIENTAAQRLDEKLGFVKTAVVYELDKAGAYGNRDRNSD